VGFGFCISIYWIYIRRSLQSLITLPITSHKPVTCSGSSFVLNWRKLFLWSFRDELLWWTVWRTPLAKLLFQTASATLLWRTPMTNCYGELLLQTCSDELLSPASYDELLRNQSLTPFVISAIHSWPVRCHDICLLTDRCLVVTIPHCFGCRGHFVYRTAGNNFSCIRGYIILMNYVSVAWQWIFPALGNSAFQTTCHIIYRLLAFVLASRRILTLSYFWSCHL
jgi:hypothetical protein